MKYEITIEDTGESYSCDEKETVLLGMTRIGQKGIPVGCCGGGCGVCKIEIAAGEYTCKAMSREHVTIEEQEARIALACRVLPRSHLIIRVVGKLKKNVCRSNDQTAH